MSESCFDILNYHMVHQRACAVLIRLFTGIQIGSGIFELNRNQIVMK
jgi:hypothetical protein